MHAVTGYLVAIFFFYLTLLLLFLFYFCLFINLSFCSEFLFIVSYPYNKRLCSSVQLLYVFLFCLFCFFKRFSV